MSIFTRCFNGKLSKRDVEPRTFANVAIDSTLCSQPKTVIRLRGHVDDLATEKEGNCNPNQVAVVDAPYENQRPPAPSPQGFLATNVEQKSLRDSLVVSSLPAIVSVLTLNGLVIHQNNQSKLFYGDCSEKENGINVLDVLFALEPAKKERILHELIGGQALWKGIVQVPVSLGQRPLGSAINAPQRAADLPYSGKASAEGPSNLRDPAAAKAKPEGTRSSGKTASSRDAHFTESAIPGSASQPVSRQPIEKSRSGHRLDLLAAACTHTSPNATTTTTTHGTTSLGSNQLTTLAGAVQQCTITDASFASLCTEGNGSFLHTEAGLSRTHHAHMPSCRPSALPGLAQGPGSLMLTCGSLENMTGGGSGVYDPLATSTFATFATTRPSYATTPANPAMAAPIVRAGQATSKLSIDDAVNTSTGAEAAAPLGRSGRPLPRKTASCYLLGSQQVVDRTSANDNVVSAAAAAGKLQPARALAFALSLGTSPLASASASPSAPSQLQHRVLGAVTANAPRQPTSSRSFRHISHRHVTADFIERPISGKAVPSQHFDLLVTDYRGRLMQSKPAASLDISAGAVQAARSPSNQTQRALSMFATAAMKRRPDRQEMALDHDTADEIVAKVPGDYVLMSLGDTAVQPLLAASGDVAEFVSPRGIGVSMQSEEVEGPTSQAAPPLTRQLTPPPRQACWHEVWATGAQDPVTGQGVIILHQIDVTEKVVAERHLALVMETEHRLVEQLFPRHILQYITEEWTSREAAAPEAAQGQAREGNDGGGSLRWRPVVQDCNALATWHPEVTLLFADIKGFTPMCKEVEPRQVMTLLNALYSRYDAMLDKYGVYKVETIGDCYFVAGGLIHEDKDGMAAVRDRVSNEDPLHAQRVFCFARAMLSAAREVLMPTTGQPVEIRIGLHTGPVVSGVVGTRMPRFCLFGDTVNTASRMESTGMPGAVHASEETYRRLATTVGWKATGGIEVKGKGLMQTYVWRPSDAVEESLSNATGIGEGGGLRAGSLSNDANAHVRSSLELVHLALEATEYPGPLEEGTEVVADSAAIATVVSTVGNAALGNTRVDHCSSTNKESRLDTSFSGFLPICQEI